MGNIRKPGGGRKKFKPEYDAVKNLKEQMDALWRFMGRTAPSNPSQMLWL